MTTRSTTGALPTAASAGSIRTEILEVLVRSALLRSAGCRVTTGEGGEVTVEGAVSCATDRRAVELSVLAAPGVVSVRNLLRVDG